MQVPAPPRVDWFEFNDAWFTPTFLREAETDFLRVFAWALGLHTPVLPHLTAALETSSARRLVDLCSGGLGPAVGAAKALDVDAVFTDRTPNHRAAGFLRDPRLRYVRDPVDATDVPGTLRGVRTVFNALHHLDDDVAARILAAAVDAREPILVVEVSERRWRAIATTLALPLLVMALLPFSRPSLAVVACTWLVPIVPLLVFWDGLVSCLRTRSAGEMLALAPPGMRWEAGQAPVPGTPVRLTWLLGLPPDQGASAA